MRGATGTEVSREFQELGEEKEKVKHMDEAAKFELEQRIHLYQFYLDAYTKGIAFFLIIASFIAKAAFDDHQHRMIFSLYGLFCNIAALIPISFAIWHERRFAKEFQTLAARTGTERISTAPFTMLVFSTAAFWLIVFFGWVWIICHAN